MSLRLKIALTLIAAVGIFVGGDNVLQRRIFPPALERQDEEQARADLAGARDALLRMAEALGAPAIRLGETFGDEPDPGELALRAAGLHVAVVCTTGGEVLWRRLRAPVVESPIELREFPAEALAPSHPLLRAMPDAPLSGIMDLELGLLLAHSRIVVGGDGVARTVVTGRFLADPELEQVVQIAGRGTRVTSFDEVSELAPGVLDDVLIRDEPWLARGGSGAARCHLVLRDLRERPILLLSSEVRPRMGEVWQRLRDYGLLSDLIVAVLFPLVLLLLLQRIVTGPLDRLASQMTRIGGADDLTLRVGGERSDEIGQLAREFDLMLEKLETARVEGERSARLAGMSELSRGVLHGVGNQLNSVTTSVSLAVQSTLSLADLDFEVPLAELRSHAGQLDEYLREDPRGKRLMDYLAALVAEHAAVSTGIRNEVGDLARQVFRVSQLVSSLTEFESGARAPEQVDLASVVEEALEFCLQVASPAPSEIERVYDELPSTWIERSPVMEILVHLIQNALQAMERSDDRRLTLRIAREGEERAVVEVSDTGTGIATEDLARIFQLGHTTREDGKGYGLHLSATRAVELGGTLTAHSEGPGRGATLRLVVPLLSRPCAASPAAA